MLFMGWGPPRLDVSREGGYWDDGSEPKEIDNEMNSASVSQPSVRVAASAAAQEDSEMRNIASVSQPSVRDTASAAPATNVGKTDGPAHAPVDFNAMD